MSGSEWKEFALSEVSEIIGGGTPKTSVPEYWGGNIPWLSVADFNNDSRHVFVTEKTVTEKGLNNSSTKLLNPGDIIISARGTVGALAQLAVPMAFNQSCYGMRAKAPTENDFLYYAIKNITSQIKASTHGSVFDTITRATFDNLKILLPSIQEQKAIAATLSCLDDKIELNNCINKNLEEIAQAIFKSWFIDFESFQDEEFEDSELGKIPKGWKAGTLGDILNLNYGKALPAKKRIKGKIRVYSSAGITGYHNEALINEPSIVIGRKGTIGAVYYSTVPSFCIDTAYFATQNDSKFPLLFMYQLLKELDLGHYNEDSAVPGLNRNTVYAINIVIPPDRVLNQCNNILTTIYNLIFDNLKQTHLLNVVRDTLLPKLMSGEIRVPLKEVQ
jgi:type I restriction enzyme S subunit